MKKINTRYLFKFLEEHSNYFTSLGFFAVLLTVTLFIKPTDNKDLNLAIVLLQSSSLMLLILCLMPLYKKIEKSKVEILQIFEVLIFLMLIGLIGYLWFSYKDVIIGISFISAIIIGVLHFNKIEDNLISTVKKKYKVMSILKKNWVSLLLFILIVTGNIILIYKGLWKSQFIEVKSMNDFFQNIYGYIFAGYIFRLALGLFALLIGLFSKIKNVVIREFK